ncbi:MAG: hypothetical protein ACKO96_39455 [Flammeovirgaceae bacterium]
MKTHFGTFLQIVNGEVVTSKKPTALLLEPLKSAPMSVDRRVLIGNNTGNGDEVFDMMDQILAIEDNEVGEMESPLFYRITSRNKIEFELDET